jgi:hypothetical protein
MGYCWRTRKRRDCSWPITSLKAPKLWSRPRRKLGFVVVKEVRPQYPGAYKIGSERAVSSREYGMMTRYLQRDLECPGYARHAQ